MRRWLWWMVVALGGISMMLVTVPAAPDVPSPVSPAPLSKKESGLRAHPTGGASPVVVSYGLYISDLSSIDEANESFEIEGYLYSSWLDQRLAVPDGSGISQDRELDDDAIWIPPLEVANLISFGFYNERFFGNSSGLIYRVRHFNAYLKEVYDLRRFPFDTQTLDLVLQPFMNPGHNDMPMVFANDSLATGFSEGGHAGLAGWRVLGINYIPKVVTVNALHRTVPEADFQIVVERRSGFYDWKVFLPIVIMVMVSWSIFWVTTKEFDWQMKIPIATMLAMVAFEFAIARDLPRVSYITFLDSVVLTSFIFVFLAMLEAVGVHVMIRENRLSLAESIHRGSRLVFPIAYTGLILILIVLFFGGSPPVH